jgi:hypothetical protein
MPGYLRGMAIALILVIEGGNQTIIPYPPTYPKEVSTSGMFYLSKQTKRKMGIP